MKKIIYHLLPPRKRPREELFRDFVRKEEGSRLFDTSTTLLREYKPSVRETPKRPRQKLFKQR